MTVESAHAKRGHVADVVFDGLIRQILLGERAPGSSLEPERVLAQHFGVSRLIVRQAVHRLADLDLVRVRQGGATTVLDPNDTNNVAIFEHLHRFGLFDVERMRDSIEHQYTNGLRLLDVAERRATEDELAAVRRLVTEFGGDPNSEADISDLDRRFWSQVAAAGGNHILKIELNWWYRNFAEISERSQDIASVPPRTRLWFLRELADRLCERKDVLEFYRNSMAPLLERLR